MSFECDLLIYRKPLMVPIVHIPSIIIFISMSFRYDLFIIFQSKCWRLENVHILSKCRTEENPKSVHISIEKIVVKWLTGWEWGFL